MKQCVFRPQISQLRLVFGNRVDLHNTNDNNLYSQHFQIQLKSHLVITFCSLI